MFCTIRKNILNVFLTARSLVVYSYKFISGTIFGAFYVSFLQPYGILLKGVIKTKSESFLKVAKLKTIFVVFFYFVKEKYIFSFEPN